MGSSNLASRLILLLLRFLSLETLIREAALVFLIKEFCLPQPKVYQFEQVYPDASYTSSFMIYSLLIF